MHQNKKSKKIKKFRLLLDSAFARPDQFPKLSKKVKLLHAVHSLGLSRQAEDSHIYQKAIEANCFVLTVNFRDFKKFIRQGKPGVIGIDSQLSNEEIDLTVSKFVSGKNPDGLWGKATKI
ncbi:MAG: hypothetical protein COU25_02545 [Candidatus Levybacteria bacterium CG10_big_fil_rev_8_21_14_0_10_35_13]|nr:MAG: hypothetical protein COU25_02545 [Candidatus Levybacteria bacterium CG10_big_fil_rev_8_21_14_0_10_35_13]